MSANRFLRLCLAAMVALLALAPATAALAVPPTQTSVYVNETFENAELTAKCGFPVQVHLDGMLKVITHLTRQVPRCAQFQVAPAFPSDVFWVWWFLWHAGSRRGDPHPQRRTVRPSLSRLSAC